MQLNRVAPATCLVGAMTRSSVRIRRSSQCTEPCGTRDGHLKQKRPHTSARFPFANARDTGVRNDPFFTRRGPAKMKTSISCGATALSG